MNYKKWNVKEKISFKKKLKDFCISIIKDKIEEAITSMQRAQEAANSEEKSSMGDKYETSKAMGQIDSDRAALQLLEGKKQLAALQLVNAENIYEEVKSGAFICCDEAYYFIATSIGAKIIDEEKINIVSPQAPVAIQMLGKKTGDVFIINGRNMTINTIF